MVLYAGDMAIIATSRKLTLLTRYLESYLNEFQRWLIEWRITIKASKSTAIVFVRIGRHFFHLRPISLFGEPIQCA